jgi:PKD domain
VDTSIAARRPFACAALVVFALAAAALVRAPVAGAYTFGSGVQAIGPEVRVFDWSAQKCADDDIPDQPSRAFRNSTGQVVFINSHHTVRRYTGPTLDNLTHSCSIVMGSGKNSDPSKYDNREWLATMYTRNGTTVNGIIHAEYQGWEYGPGYCIKPGELFEDKMKCWYNALTMTTSTNGGSTFQHTTPPTHYVAGPPYVYSAGIGPIGFFQPSNIVRGIDGYYYLMVHTEDYGAQPLGSCLLRSSRLDETSSWRMWDGTGFTRRFRDPYLYSYPPQEGVCAPVTPQHIGTLSESLTWNTYFKKWMLVGSSDNADGVSGAGFYYFLSDDLINWSVGKLLMNGELPWTYHCQDGPEQLRDPSLLDKDSLSRNFDTVGQRPFLYFTRFNVQFNSPTSCYTSLDRDLIRIPIEFSNQQPGGPSAALAASTTTARTGEPVTFDASGSSDADGSIVKYEWDLDGDGTYERDTGTSPVTKKAYDAPDSVTVTVRVSDDDGKATDDTAIVRVEPAGGPPPPAAATGPSPTAGGIAPAAATASIGRMSSPRSARGDARGVVLRVRVPAAGTLRVRSAAGRRAMRTARTSTARGGLVALRVLPSRAGRALIARHGRLRLRLVLSFTPVTGVPQTSTTLVTLLRERPTGRLLTR